MKYEPLIRPQDTAGDRAEHARSWRSTAPEMRKYYYDPTRYKTYLEQLGIQYPTVEEIPASVSWIGIGGFRDPGSG